MNRHVEENLKALGEGGEAMRLYLQNRDLTI